MKIKIIIAMHKPYQVPKDDVYLPLQVGAAGRDPIETAQGIAVARDDGGENISLKNDTYCELTGLYWAWKNLQCDALGLVHYRRYFTRRGRCFRRGHAPMEAVLSGREAEELLAECDIIVPAKRRYYIETLYSHYAHTLDARHLDVAKEVIAERFPEYASACEKVYAARGGYMFNMFLMKRPELEDYCGWLFAVLEEMEPHIDVSGLGDFEKRLYGRVSEILFNVWLERRTEAGAAVREVPWMYMEKVNPWKKGMAFLRAKFLGTKYRQSF